MSTALVFIQSFALLPLLIRALGAEEFGRYALLTSVLGVISGISSFGLGFLCMRQLPAAPRDGRAQLFIPQVLLHAASTAGLALLFLASLPWLLANVIDAKPGYVRGWPCVLYLLAYTLYSQSNSYLRFTGRSRWSSLQSLVFVYLSFALILSVVLFGTGNLDALILAQAISAGVLTLPVGVVIYRELRGQQWRMPPVAAVRRDVGLGLPVVSAFVLDLVLTVGDRYVISVFLGVEAVAYYTAAYSIGSLLLLVPKSILISLPAALSKAMDGEDALPHRSALLNSAWRAHLLISVMFVLGSALVAEEALLVVTGAQLPGAIAAVVPIIALGSAFYGVNLLLSSALAISMRPGAVLRINLIAASANIALNVFGLSVWADVRIAAAATVLSYALAALQLRTETKGSWPLRLESRFVTQGLLIIAVTAGVLVIVRSVTATFGPVERLLLQASAALVVFAGLAVGLGTVRDLTRAEPGRA